MADTALITTLVKTNHKSGYVLSSKSDGTGEPGVTKIDISTLPGAPARVKITKISWAIEGMVIGLAFDRTVSDPVLFLSNAGSLDLDGMGPIVDAGTGGTGDIKLTTFGAAANKGYTINIEVEKD